jgi:hypothetical protein
VTGVGGCGLDSLVTAWLVRISRAVVDAPSAPSMTKADMRVPGADMGSPAEAGIGQIGATLDTRDSRRPMMPTIGLPTSRTATEGTSTCSPAMPVRRGWTAEVAEQPLSRRICNEPVVLFRDATAALLDVFCHRAAPLHLGRVTERGLACGYHGLTLDRSGHYVPIPSQDRIPERARIRASR